MSDNDATRKRHHVADPLREYVDVINRIINLPHLTYVDDTLCKRLLELADQIDRDHERRMKQQAYELRRAFCRYIGGIINDYRHGMKRKRLRK